MACLCFGSKIACSFLELVFWYQTMKKEVIQDNSEAIKESEPDHTRRRLTGTALGASAIFTLASRPVWGGTASALCTISGMQSGNISRPQQTCEGCTPGFWKVCQHLQFWSVYTWNQTFNSVFGTTEYVDCTSPAGIPYTLLDVLYLNGNTYSCSANGNSGNGPAHPNFIPSTNCNGNGNIYPSGLGGDPLSVNLGFQAVAALLSASSPNVNYGYTATEIIQMFQNVYATHDPIKLAALKDTFDWLNNRGCPLGGPG
jgi:hypothetical protein